MALLGQSRALTFNCTCVAIVRVCSTPLLTQISPCSIVYHRGHAITVCIFQSIQTSRMSDSTSNTSRIVFASPSATILGNIQIFCAVLAFLLELLAMLQGAFTHATGIWTSIFFAVSGGLALSAKKGQRSVNPVIGGMTTQISQVLPDRLHGDEHPIGCVCWCSHHRLLCRHYNPNR